MILLIILFLFFGVFPALQTELLARDYFDISGDVISYDHEGNFVEVVGAARLLGPDIELKADTMRFYGETGDIVASGDPVDFSYDEENLRGESLSFNIYTGEGSLAYAEGKVEEAFFKGDEVALLQEADHTIEVSEGMLTPCLMPDPHYRVEAENIKVYPREKIVGESVSFFWGERRIFTLPSYTVEIREDEETGEFEAAPISPAYEIGYDWDLGPFLEINVPYELGGLVAGKLYFMNTALDRREILFENEITPTGNLTIEPYYERIDDVEEDDDEEEEEVWQEDYGADLVYSPGNFYLETGYNYEDDTGEIEDILYGGYRYDLTSEIFWRQHLTHEREWEAEDEEMDEERYVVSTLNYTDDRSELQYDLHYGFFDEVWRQEFTIARELEENARVDLYHDRRDGKLYRHDYSLSGSADEVDWSINYRDGYDLEYLPYVMTGFEPGGGFDVGFEFGRLDEEGERADQILFNPGWSYSFNPFSGFDFETDIDYQHILYSSAENAQALSTSLGFNYEGNVNPDWDWEISLDREENIVWQETLLERDEIEEKEIYSLSLGTEVEGFFPGIFPLRDKEENVSDPDVSAQESFDAGEEKNNKLGMSVDTEYDLKEGEFTSAGGDIDLELMTGAPKSSVKIAGSGEYDLQEEEWEQLEARLERHLDCYNFFAGFDFVRRAPAFGFDFDI